MNAALNLYLRFRWLVIAVAVSVMMVISIYQYSWFLFAYSIHKELQWSPAALGMTFTVFNLATFVQPFSGFLADTISPRKVSLIGAVLVGAGFVISSFVTQPWHLYLLYGLGGLGVGALYGVATASAIKWFPDRRGLATGLVVFGFGAGTALFNVGIEQMLASIGFRKTFLLLGMAMWAFLLPLGVLFHYPPEEKETQRRGAMDSKEARVDAYRPLEMLRTYQWPLIYFSFIFTISIVLMFGAQMKMLAKEFGMPQEYFRWVLILFPLGNGLSRVLAGAVSDRIGRERTMTAFYTLLGLAIMGLVFMGHVPVLFVTIVFLSALLGGSPFALYPALIGDYYGARYATTNYGLTYTAKVWAGVISGWLSGWLVVLFGSYRVPLIILALCCLVAAFLSNPRILRRPEARAIS
jgi:OFA family oxalate/formate antiporter-like MFS transporter